jgi:hypothetical protein
MLSCRKWNLSKFPTVKTQLSSNVKYNSATINGTIIEDGGAEVIDRGFCWSIIPNPKLMADSTRSLGAGNDSFSAAISKLVAGTKYYYRAYATNSVGTQYGALDSFITLANGIPSVKTIMGYYVTDSSAVCGDSLIIDGGAPITTIGFVWDSVPNPTESSPNKRTHSISDPYLLDTIRNLRTGTTYYIRAFASNKYGTAYGDQLSFRTGGNQVILPLVTTSSVTNISKNSAKCGGAVLNSGWAPVTVRGIVWGSSPGPSVALSTKTVDGNDIGTFTSSITGLTVNSTYYVKAYASNIFGTSYGEEVSFTTIKEVPELSTTSVSNIINTGANSGGNITDDGGEAVTTRGVVWNTSPSPTIALSTKTVDGVGPGLFISNISGLSVNATYYVRAYATNTIGTGYGNEIAFTTVPLLPELTTAAVISITGNAAVSGGNITDDGGAAVTARGVVWSTSPGPTIVLSTKTVDGTGAGIFVSNLTGLIPQTLYYVRAYATNISGTSYGDETSFKTAWACGYPLTVTHIMGAFAPENKTVTYATISTAVSGATKCWIRQNLGASQIASSSFDVTDASAGWYWQFNRSQGYKNVGASPVPLYPTSNDINENSNWLPSRDPCTNLLGAGWRIPTAIEWQNALPSLSIPFASDLKLHHAGHIANSPVYFELDYRGTACFCWSSSQSGIGYGQLFFYQNVYLPTVTTTPKYVGESVRCIKD